jgi:hypothetical protein
MATSRSTMTPPRFSPARWPTYNVDRRCIPERCVAVWGVAPRVRPRPRRPHRRPSGSQDQQGNRPAATDDAAVAPGRGPRADPCRFGRLKLLVIPPAAADRGPFGGARGISHCRRRGPSAGRTRAECLRTARRLARPEVGEGSDAVSTPLAWARWCVPTLYQFRCSAAPSARPGLCRRIARGPCRRVPG